jgi:glutathione S-transferase
MTMRLFYYPHAPFSRKVLLAAHEKGVEVERELSLPFDREAKGRLRAAHPLATVPLLVDGDEIITESSLIVEYLDLASDEAPRLVPPDPREALRVRALDRFGDSYLMAPTQYLAWSLRKPPEAQNTAKIEAQRAMLETALGIADARLASREFLAGAALSMGDLSSTAAISCLLSDRTLPDLARWPSVAAWHARMTARASFRRILEECATVPLPPGF